MATESLQFLETSFWFPVLLFCHRTQYWVKPVRILVRNTIAWIEETVFYCRATCTAFLQVLYIKLPAPRMHWFHFFLFITGIFLCVFPRKFPWSIPSNCSIFTTVWNSNSVPLSAAQWSAVTFSALFYCAVQLSMVKSCTLQYLAMQ